MHLNLSQPVLLVLLLAWFAQSQLSQSPNLELGFGHKFLVFDNQNFTRLKRQLFREDIPHHRPLSGNHYAAMHGFPHPGRWADGMRSLYKPTGNLPPPHQAFFDALDGGRVGRYHTGFSGLGSGGGSSGGYYSGGGGGHTGNDLSQVYGGGGSDYGISGFDDDHHHPDPLPLVHQEHYGPGGKGQDFPDYEAPPHVNVQHHGVYPQHKPNYGAPPQPQKPVVEVEQPKTIVHYHPIQYSQVLNIPEGPGPQTSYGQPAPPTTYGPPNHVSGPPIGPPVEHGGFVPSKGIATYNPHPHHEDNHVPKKPIVHLHHHHHHQELGSDGGPYRFDPFKLFKQPVEQAEGPVKIPILAQFHSAKPIKFTQLKEPVHIIYRHPPGGGSGPKHYGPPHPHSRRPPFNFHNFHNRRPKMPPQNHPDWFFSHRH